MSGLVAIEGGQVLGKSEIEPETGHHRKHKAQVVEIYFLKVIFQMINLRIRYMAIMSAAIPEKIAPTTK